MNKLIHIKQKEQGQSMVELALTITFLMILLAGTIDLGRAFFTWLALRNAAQEGASYGSFDPGNTGEIINRVKDNYKDVIKDPTAVVAINIGYSGHGCLGSPSNPAPTINVSVDYNNFPITMPFLGMILGQTIPIHAEVNDTILKPMCPTP